MGWNWRPWVWGVLVCAGLLGCGGVVDAGAESGLAPAASEAPLQASTQARKGALRWYWSATGDPGEEDSLLSVAHDRQGNIIAVGTFGKALLVGVNGERIEGRGPRSALVVKFNPKGRLLWYRSFGSEAPVNDFVGAVSVAVDRRGNIVILGASGNPIDLGGGSLPAGQFLVKLDPKGRHLWSRSFPLGGPVAFSALVTDRDDDLLLAGVIPDEGRGLLMKLTPGGVERWRLVDALPRGRFISLAVDDDENVFVGGGELFSGNNRPFVMKVSPRGVPRWTRTLETAAGIIRSIAAAGDRVVVSGNFLTSLSFAGRTLSAGDGGVAGFLAAFNRHGDERWARKMGLGGDGTLVATDGCGGLVAGGNYVAGDDLGRGPEAGLSGGNLYVTRVDREDGDARWVHTFPSDFAIPLGLSMARDGSSTLVGAFIFPIDIGEGPVGTEPRQDDLFILNLSP